MTKYESKYTDSYLINLKKGESYDRIIENRFELFIWELEKHFLKKAFLNFLKNSRDIQYLDFACGTGRIITFFKKDLKLENALGIDTSSSMIEEAGKKSGAEFLCGNIVENQDLLGDKKFDLITSFRLFLNIEKENREIILKELYKYLKEDGYLIINNHINRFSLIGIQFWIRKNLFKEKGRIINTATEKEFTKMLNNSGFNVLKVYKFTFFPGRKNVIFLPKDILFKLELSISKIPFLRNFCLSQIYVCQKKI